MIVPVIWPARNLDFIARGYYDQALLEAVLSRELWRPPHPVEFEHYEVHTEFPDVPGALVVFNGRANVDDADWLIGSIHALDWSVVIVTGDEEWRFPWARIGETDTRRVWVMAPEPEHVHVSYRIPGGWYPGTRETLRDAEHDLRPFDWFFAGQVTNQRREQCAETLRGMPRGELVETEGFLQGIPREEYLRAVAMAKVIPCPSGPMQVDTARPLSALEAGCVPVVDMVRPRDDVAQHDYWALTFGDDCPLTRVWDWHAFPHMLDIELAEWPANANRLSAWWQQWKRRTVHTLDADLRAVMTAADPESVNRADKIDAENTPDDLVTVIVTTSPAPLHPSLDHIEQTIASIRAQLPEAEIVIVADGVREEQEDRRADYDEYLRRLVWACNFDWHNVVPVLMPEWVHQANATRAALELVTTPLVLFVEHDTPLLGEIDWPGLCALVRSGEANSVRFLETIDVEPEHASIMLDQRPRHVGPVPARRTIAWWQRPHLASAAFYRERIMPMFAPGSRTMIEEVVYATVMNDCEDRGEPGWWDWRLWVYCPSGGMRRHVHLDSRGNDTKYPMDFAGTALA